MKVHNLQIEEKIVLQSTITNSCVQVHSDTNGKSDAKWKFSKKEYRPLTLSTDRISDYHNLERKGKQKEQKTGKDLIL